MYSTIHRASKSSRAHDDRFFFGGATLLRHAPRRGILHTPRTAIIQIDSVIQPTNIKSYQIHPPSYHGSL